MVAFSRVAFLLLTFALTLVDIFTSIGSLPAVLKVALPILVILLIGAVVKKVMKFVLIIALVILAIVFIYPLFDF